MKSLSRNLADLEVITDLLGVIQSKAVDNVETNTDSSDRLNIKSQVLLKKIDQNHIMDSGFNFASEVGAAISSVLKLTVSFSGVEATNISVLLKNPEAIKLKINHFNIERLEGSKTPAILETEFMVDNRVALTELSIEVTATYDFMGGTNTQTGNIYKSIPISLQAYCYLISPVKEADYKLTLEANSEIPALSSVFNSFIEETSSAKEYYENHNVLSFLLNDGSISTIIVAKSSSKIRFNNRQIKDPGQ